MAATTTTNYNSSSSSSMSSLNTPSQSNPSLSNRRVRFAPLPDPRRLDVNDLQVIHNIESKRNSYNSFDEESSSSYPPSDSECPPLYCKPTTQQMLAHHSISPALHWSKPKSLSLLPFPFKKLSPTSSIDSSHSLTPTPSLDTNPAPTHSRAVSSENVLSLNMFRSSSNTSSSNTSWGFGLTRWASPCTSKNGSPLARSQSVPSKPSARPSTPNKLNSTPSNVVKPRSDSTSSTSSTSSTKINPRKGLRMLNGRVYGGPKHRHSGVGANPFANARDEDVEFVEWGYGGMGSVRGAQSAGVVGRADDRQCTKWERLQHSGLNVVMEQSSTEKRAEDDVDEDDGSGMGWVRKRKAARERKEREEKERAEAESAQNRLPQVEPPISEVAKSPVRHSSPSPITPRPGTPADEDTPIHEHILTAVTLPVHLSWHHSHKRAHPRSASVDTVPSDSTVGPDTKEAPAESDSETESEDDVALQGEDEYGDDEDDEEDEKGEGRKTALGAGVEKISRHN